jgi:2-succinyl-6-hydroxy-2,4-cyclohexadiene-1-carboxylate synthase
VVRLVLVHGFSQTPATWESVRSHLGAYLGDVPHEPVAPEVPRDLDFVQTARSLVGGGGRGVYVGYSMGGRLCLRAALDRPSEVTGLVLVSSGPGISGGAGRAQRAAEDERLARRIEQIGVHAFIEEWLSQPIFSTLHVSDDEIERRAAAYTVERLAHQVRALGQGSQEPLWDRLHELAMPCLVVVGGEDARYGAIAEKMKATIPASRLGRLPGGHSLPLEQPSALASMIADWVRDEAHRISP